MWLGAFIWVLAHKEKDADITSETKSQPEQKGFYGFCTMNFRQFVAMNQKKLGQSVFFS